MQVILYLLDRLSILYAFLLFPKTAMAGDVGRVISRMNFRFRFRLKLKFHFRSNFNADAV